MRTSQGERMLKRFKFSDDSVIEDSACRLAGTDCDGELRAMWWFRKPPGSRVVVCRVHASSVWETIAPYVNSGMDHFEMGLPL